jgi:hypothetical protein
MKIRHFLFVLVVLLPGLALSQNDIEQTLGGSVQQTEEISTTTGSNQATSQVEVKGSIKTDVKDYASVQQIEDHVLRGDKPSVVKNYYNTYKTYVTPTRAKTQIKRPEEGSKTMPNQSVPKNPNVDGAFKVDPNIFPEGSGSVTVSAGSDGSFYVHRDSGSAGLGPWLWIILGLLAFALVMAAVAAMVRGSGGGGNTITINNAPGGSSPQPPAPQAQGGNGGSPSPFAQPNQPAPSDPGDGHGNGTGAGLGPGGNQLGVVQVPVVLVHAYPTGSPAQEKPKQESVVIHNHINLPKPDSQESKRQVAQPKKPASKKTEPN